MLLGVSDNDVVQLEVIVKEPRLMDHPDWVKELDAHLESGLLAEGLISLKKVVFEGFTELILDDVWPDLRLKLSDQLLFLGLWLFRRFLFISLGDESWVSDEAFTLGVGVREGVFAVVLVSKLIDFDESLKLLIVHRMVLGEFDNDRVLDSVDSVFGVVTSVDLTKGSFWKLALDPESSFKDWVSQLVDGWHLTVLLQDLLECDLLLEMVFHDVCSFCF